MSICIYVYICIHTVFREPGWNYVAELFFLVLLGPSASNMGVACCNEPRPLTHPAALPLALIKQRSEAAKCSLHPARSSLKWKLDSF